MGSKSKGHSGDKCVRRSVLAELEEEGQWTCVARIKIKAEPKPPPLRKKKDVVGEDAKSSPDDGERDHPAKRG